jgi:hypothetical protein
MWYVYSVEYLAINRNEIMSFAGEWIEVEISMLRKVSQVQKNRGHMFSFICGR